MEPIVVVVPPTFCCFCCCLDSLGGGWTLVSYSQDMLLCGSSLGGSCGSWSPYTRLGSAQLDLVSFVQATGANGTVVSFQLHFFLTKIVLFFCLAFFILKKRKIIYSYSASHTHKHTRTHTTLEFLFTWTAPDYSGPPPTGGVTSYGVAYRVGRLSDPTLWSFNGSATTTEGPECSQGWANLTGTCLQGTGVNSPLPFYY